MTELAIQNSRLLPGKYGISRKNAAPRTIYTAVMAPRTVRRNGSLTMTPAPENAYSDHVERTTATTSAAMVGYQRPAEAICAICSPAPRNRYHDAPKIMHPMCKSAANALKNPATIRK